MSDSEVTCFQLPATATFNHLKLCTFYKILAKYSPTKISPVNPLFQARFPIPPLKLLFHALLPSKTICPSKQMNAYSVASFKEKIKFNIRHRENQYNIPRKSIQMLDTESPVEMTVPGPLSKPSIEVAVPGPLSKLYILRQFEQIHLAIWTNTFDN